MRRASRSQPGLGARSELSTPARIGRAAETWRAAAARSWIRSRAPSVPHDCRPNAAVLRLTRRGGTAECRSESCARLRRRGCGARVRPESSAASRRACSLLEFTPVYFGFTWVYLGLLGFTSGLLWVYFFWTPCETVTWPFQLERRKQRATDSPTMATKRKSDLKGKAPKVVKSKGSGTSCPGAHSRARANAELRRWPAARTYLFVASPCRYLPPITLCRRKVPAPVRHMNRHARTSHCPCTKHAHNYITC